MGDLTTSLIVHVIDSKTSYKLLLGHPWLHEHEVVVSTLHQCLKYYRDGKKKINSDVKPFTMAESHFADAKLFNEDAVLKEITLAAIASIGKESVKNAKKTRAFPEKSGDGSIKPQQQ